MKSWFISVNLCEFHFLLPSCHGLFYLSIRFALLLFSYSECFRLLFYGTVHDCFVCSREGCMLCVCVCGDCETSHCCSAGLVGGCCCWWCCCCFLSTIRDALKCPLGPYAREFLLL
uniref:Uncharacterized protein n=1 Tax=Trypanosoma congolense (strain IL3000) TaxID=1068625 RepID=G0UL55_TRYCI|nr:hypothetical protein, unlikely [Trypanosoma congolense IL3000]